MNENEVEKFFARADYAKVHISGLNRPSSAIRFSSKVEESEFRLIELNDDLERALESGESIVVRGDPDDEVVICTATKTFDIKICTTSNELLVSPDLIIPKSKTGPAVATASLVLRVQDYMEPKEILPRLDKLLTILPRFNVKDEVEPKGITTEELLDRIQSSKVQIFNELNRLGAVERNGWKVLSDVDSIVVEISKAIDSESWPLDHIDPKALVGLINEFEDAWQEWAVIHTLTFISNSNEDGIISICPKKLSIQVGHWILRESPGRSVEIEAFMDFWETILPDNVTPDVKDLFSFSYLGTDTSRGRTTKVIVYLDPLSLPSDPLQLFDSLFALKRQWSEAELRGLTLKITPPGKQCSFVISKYCRQTKQPDGSKLFTIQQMK